MTLPPLLNSIFFREHTMCIREFSLSDNEIVNFFKEFDGQDLVGKFVAILRAGIAASKACNETSNIDYVEKEFFKLIENVKEMMDENLDPLKEGTSASKLMHEIIKRTNDITNELQKMNTQFCVNQAKDSVFKQTTVKGRQFEDLCENILNDITRVHGDTIERTTNTTGLITNSKEGDFVITLGNKINKKIVIEVKDLRDTISVKDIRTFLDKAKKNRGAQYGIFVAKYLESLPESVGRFNEFEGDLVCALGTNKNENDPEDEFLLIAYRWAKMIMMMESHKENKLDVNSVRGRVSSARAKLNELEQISIQCGNIDKAVLNIREGTKRVTMEASQILSDILSSLTSTTV